MKRRWSLGSERKARQTFIKTQRQHLGRRSARKRNNRQARGRKQDLVSGAGTAIEDRKQLIDVSAKVARASMDAGAVGPV